MTEETETTQRSPIGVMIVNLGTPEAPTPRALRRYLRQFLGDPFVELHPSPVVWWFVLNFVVLPFRPRKSAALYQRVWTEEGSPLTVFSRRQQDALGRELGAGFRVELGYRYGEPSIAEALANLSSAGCKRIVMLPLFPQDSISAFGTSVLEVERILAGWVGGDAPRVDVIAPFFDHPGYVSAVAELVREKARTAEVGHYVFSFHGLPVSFIERGEPYRDQCEATASAVAAELGLAEQQWTLAFQSKFGRTEWLTPATAGVVADLGTKHKCILVACPGFPADCLETIEEIGMLASDTFRASGGEELLLTPALNDSPAWVRVMADMVREKAGAEASAL